MRRNPQMLRNAPHVHVELIYRIAMLTERALDFVKLPLLRLLGRPDVVFGGKILPVIVDAQQQADHDAG